MRQLEAVERRFRVHLLLMELGLKPGAQAEIARTLGVSQATISRDMAKVMSDLLNFCPTCRYFRGFTGRG